MWRTDYTWGGSARFGIMSSEYCNGKIYILAAEDVDSDRRPLHIVILNLDSGTPTISEDYTPVSNEYPIVTVDGAGLISIRYTIPYSISVKIEAFDIQGRLVTVIQESFKQKGIYDINWDIRRFGSGIYLLKLNANDSSVSKKVITR